MKLKKYLALLISLVLVFSSMAVLACEEVVAQADNNSEDSLFTDVGTDHWAYDAIKSMVERKIISGYPDHSFKPAKEVTRAEFAKIMVLALDLEVKKPGSATFKDISKDNWAFPYVETAKYYLTGFRTPQGDYFKPETAAVREDMAVALVKALGYGNETADEGVLNVFTDKGEISSKLTKYIAIAVKHGIMQGNPIEGSDMKTFKAQDPLTRAQAALLLYKSMGEDKVTYDGQDEGEKVSYCDIETPQYATPEVKSILQNGKLVLTWNPIKDERLQGYKVVVSKNNPNPEYPKDGYLYWITDKNRSYAIIDNHEPYKNGDFGTYLTPGEEYYFSVTAVYKDVTLPGNAIKLKFPGNASSEYAAPQVSGYIDGSKIILRWRPIDDNRLQGYKVVISKNNASPKYPDDGYLYWITDKNRVSATIDNSEPYKGGDFGERLTPGQSYYFSVTAVYNDVKTPGNVITLTYPGSAENNTSNQYVAPQLSGKVDGGRILLGWQRINSDKLQGYKVVISKSNASPKYPDDGYLYWITDKNYTYAKVDNSSAYNGGDFGEYLLPGETYYFSITAVYDDRKVPGNVITLTYPD